MEDAQQHDETSTREGSEVLAEVEILVEDLEDPAIGAMLDALRGVFANGDARLTSFLIGTHRDLDDVTLENRAVETAFWPNFVAADPVSDELAWLGEINLDVMADELEELSPFFLDGDLAQALIDGGAYFSKRFPGTADEAKRLGLGFCSALFDGRWDAVIVRTTKAAWASWFMGAPWDRTWLGFDRSAGRAWLLCVTDTD
ncbi:MAG: hypothetical protein P8127_00210 [Acidobacteriota bacterium]